MCKHYLWIDNQPLSLFAEDEDAFCFEERPLLIANTGDIVILDYKINKQYVASMNNHLNRNVKVLCTEDKSFDLVQSILQWKHFELFKKHIVSNSFTIRSYIPDERINYLSEKLGVKALGYEMYVENNTQTRFYQLREQLKFNQIQTISIGNSTTEQISSFFYKNDGIICKPDMSIGGKGVKIVKTIDEVLCNKKTLYNYVLQEKLPIEYEGSIQFLYICDRFIIRICQTYNQNNSFSGFHYPFHVKHIEQQLEKDANTILHYMISKYGNNVDSFGVDFIISNDKIYYHDLNPRKTAVTYMMSFLEKMYSSMIKGNTLKAICKYIHIRKKNKYTLIDSIVDKYHLKIGYPCLYEGVIIVNPSTIYRGLLQAISVSTVEKENYYMEKFVMLLQNEGIITENEKV